MSSNCCYESARSWPRGSWRAGDAAAPILQRLTIHAMAEDPALDGDRVLDAVIERRWPCAFGLKHEISTTASEDSSQNGQPLMKACPGRDDPVSSGRGLMPLA